MVQDGIHADNFITPPEQPVCHEVIFMQAAFGVVEEFPDLGAVEFVPRYGVDGAVGGIELIEQVLATEYTLLCGMGGMGRLAALAVFLHVLYGAQSHVGIVLFTGVIQGAQISGQDHVVRVYKGIVPSAGCINAGIARCREPWFSW